MCDDMQSGSKVQLHAGFPPTLAFYVTYSLKPTDASDCQLISHLCYSAAETFCSNRYTAALMSDATLQSQIAALPAEEILPIDSSQTQKALTSEVLTKLPEAVRPVLLCMQILRHEQPGLTILPQEYTSVNDILATLCNGKVAAEPDLPLPQSPLFRHVAVLRSALLVMKAAIVSAEGFGKPCKPYSTKQVLWNTVHIIGAQLYASAVDAKARLTELPSAGSPLAADIDQAQHLSSVLINLIMPILKQHIKSSSHAGQQPRENVPTFCCIVLDCLLTSTESPVLQALTQAAASHMLQSGQTLAARCMYITSDFHRSLCMHGDAVSSTFAIGCCGLQNKQHVICLGQFQQSQHCQSMSLCNPHTDRYAVDQIYTLRYLSKSDAGALTILTATLEQGNIVARHAFLVLQRLSAKPSLPIEQAAANEALLARMQGLRRCSALLCPIFSQDQALQAQQGDASALCSTLCVTALSTAKLAAVLWTSMMTDQALTTAVQV